MQWRRGLGPACPPDSREWEPRGGGGGDVGPGLRQATLGAGARHTRSVPRSAPTAASGASQTAVLGTRGPAAAGRRAEHSSDTGVVHGLYSPHSSESRSRGAGTRASLGNAQARALPQPQVPGAARTPGRQGWGGHCIQGARCARRGVVGEEPGGRVKLTATAAQPQSLQGTLRLRGERARSPAAGALGGTGSSPLRLMTTAELWHGARPPPTALLSLAAPARGRYPAEMPSLGALGLVCTAEASGGDGPSGLSLTGPGMGRDAARGPVLHLRQRPSCPPCPALVQCPCHPQPPPRVCRPWAAHPVAVERLPGAKPLSGL